MRKLVIIMLAGAIPVGFCVWKFHIEALSWPASLWTGLFFLAAYAFLCAVLLFTFRDAGPIGLQMGLRHAGEGHTKKAVAGLRQARLMMPHLRDVLLGLLKRVEAGETIPPEEIDQILKANPAAIGARQRALKSLKWLIPIMLVLVLLRLVVSIVEHFFKP